MHNAPLWSHQQSAISRASKRFALFFDPGCGKSRTAIELYKKAVEPEKNSPDRKIRALKAIIFAPLNVCRNWENELKKYLGCDYKAYLVAGQSKAKKLGILAEFVKNTGVDLPTFLICNLECLRSVEYRSLLIKSKAKFLIVDESHNFKSATSLQTKGLLELDRTLNPDYLYLLTGTPAPQGEIDLWSTFSLLKKTNDNFYVWRRKNFIDKNERRRGHRNYWPEYICTPEVKDRIKKQLQECSVVAKKNEVLDLPPLLRTNIYAEMSREQAKHYENMHEYLFAIDSEGEELNASNLLVRTLRLQQILAGFIGDKPMIENPRLKALEAAIDLTNGAQFIIWTIFQPTYAQLHVMLDKMGISHGHLTGEIIPAARQENMERFQTGIYRALIAHPKAGGVGVNLTAASYSIHYTRSFSLVDDLQCEARNYRGGSEIHDRITRIDVITPNTIDEQISEALREKKTIQDFILSIKQSV